MHDALMKRLLALAVCTVTGAADAAGLYAGGSFGPADVDVRGYDDASSFRLFLGTATDPNDNLALEVGYVDLGTFDVIGSSADVDAWGVDLSLRGKLPVSDAFALCGKLGLFAWDAEANIPGLAIRTDTGTDITYGIGGEFRLSGNWDGRVAWDYYPDVSGGDIDVISFGLLYRLY